MSEHNKHVVACCKWNLPDFVSKIREIGNPRYRLGPYFSWFI